MSAIIISEFPLNRHKAFRAEIEDRAGKLIISIARWKKGPDGSCRRAGPTFEFAAHRLEGIAGLIADVQRLLGTHESETHGLTATAAARKVSA